MSSSHQIHRLIRKANGRKYDDYNLITLIHRYKGVKKIYWIDATNTQTIYCDEDGIALFHKTWDPKSQFDIKQIPKELVTLYTSIGYYHNVITKLPSDSFEAAEYGSNFSFQKVSIMSNLCLKFAKQLHQYKENKMSRETKQYAIKLLNNWEKNNKLNDLTNSDQHLFYMLMANLLHQMSLEYAINNKLDKALIFCKQASSYINLSNWNPSSKELTDLIKYNRLSKFNALSPIQLIHLKHIATCNQRGIILNPMI